MLAHSPFFGRNLRGSPDFLAHPVPKAYRQAALSWYLGSEVLGSLGPLESLTPTQRATPKRGLRVPHPNSRGHATKGGLDNWPSFLNGTGRLKALNNAPSKMPGAHPVH